jgi:phage tail sheath protein FI
VDNATAVGYIDSATGEFKTVSLTESSRDALHTAKVNPITFFSGAGIVNFGNLTKVAASSSLDRINVSRLVVYLRSQLDAIAKPFIFEPNDGLTRNEIKQAIESFLLELVGQRALYDFLVVCDETNNTPTRIDRNELYVDIAIEPVKSVEFIYIPLRIKNTGEIANLGQ